MSDVLSSGTAIRTPDQRLRVFVSSTQGELAEEQLAVLRAISALRLTPVVFELGPRLFELRMGKATCEGGLSCLWALHGSLRIAHFSD